MKKIILIVILAVVVLTFFSLYTINEKEIAVKFRLGKIVAIETEAGLYFKTPFINNINIFDKRIQTLDERPDRFLTGEKKNVIVDSYVKWRISNAKDFYTSTGGNIDRANERLSQIIKTGLKSEFSKRTITEVVAGQRVKITRNIKEIAKENVKEFGIDIVDVRIKRIDLAKEVSDSVYDRMRTERQRVAKDFRSKGSEQAEKIRALADKKRTIILANAYKNSEIIRGVGDAKSVNIYAIAYNKDKDFYSLYRSLESYKKSFTSKDDILVLNPNTEFFRYFNGLNVNTK